MEKTFHKPRLFSTLITRILSSWVFWTFIFACFKLPKIHQQDTPKNKWVTEKLICKYAKLS